MPLLQDDLSTNLGAVEIAEVWRYPVKSMAGERVGRVDLTGAGLPRDRGIAVFDPRGTRPTHPVSARQLPALLSFRAILLHGEVLIAGPNLPQSPWSEPQVVRRLAEVCDRQLKIAAVDGGAFDDSPIHVVALSTVEHLSQELGRVVDHRRFRANLYLRVNPDERRCEPEWVGRQLHFGKTALAVERECPRCVVTTRDPDTNQSWPKLLRHLAATRDAMVGAYCRVDRPGPLEEGLSGTVS